MPDQRGRRGLPVRSGDCNNLWTIIHRTGVDLTGQNFDITNNRDAGFGGRKSRWVRLWQYVRHAGRQNKFIHRGPVDLGKIVQVHTLIRRRLSRRLIIVPCPNGRSARLQRQSSGNSGPTQTEYGDGSPFECSGFDHRSFNVASPIRARMMEIIQKRMTMVGSCHPFCS